LLTKHTYIVPVLIALLVFPAVAIAGSEGKGSVQAGVIADARVATLAPVQLPIDRFQRTIHVFAKRIRAERRAEARRRQRELYAQLPGSVSIETLDAIAACESGGDPTAVSADGSYRGKYQFDYGTWESVGGHGDPAAAPEAEQDYRAALLYSRSGSSPWPVCG
jgi:Transglycosylase-like domain